MALASLLRLGLALLLLVPSSVACTALTTPDPVLRLYPAAQSRTDGPFLSVDNTAASGTDVYEQGEGLAGLQRYPQTLDGGAGLPSATFTAKAPLARNHYLNLSSPIRVLLWVSSEFQDTSGSTNWPAAETRRVRVELLVDGALAGGVDFSHNQGTWFGINACFRPETRLLPEGSMISVRITFLAAQTNLRVGVGGTHQSVIEVAYYNVDPLASGAYRNGTKIRFSALEDGGSQDRSPDVAPLLAPLLLLAAGRGARRRSALGLALVLLAAGLSGCTGSRPGGPLVETAGTSPRVEIDFQPRNGSALGLGSIEGRVIDSDRANASVPGADVIVLGTNFYKKADGLGAFRFPDVPPGTYELRVDAKGYAPVQEPIQVMANQTTVVRVPLQVPRTGERGLQPHDHGNWGDATTAPFQDLDAILPASHVWVTSDLDLGPALAQTGLLGNRWICSTSTTLVASAGYQYRDCQTPLRIDTSKVVMPGADRIQVVLQWNTGAEGAPRELGLRATSGSAGLPELFMPRAPGVPFNIVFFPHEADPGHQKFTNWQFWLTLAYPAVGTKNLYNSVASIEALMTQHRGVVPIEPAHREFWKESSRIALAGPKIITGYSYLAYPSPNAEWRPSEIAAFVPPGTREIVGWLNWTTRNGAPELPIQDWGVRYKGAHEPSTAWLNLESLPRAASTTTGRSIAFRIDLSSEQAQRTTDQFYQERSYWSFYLDDGEDRVTGGYGQNDGSLRSWKMEAYALKDPAYAAS